MAAILLPSAPGPKVQTPRLITSRGEQRPVYGGPVQRQPRPGSRWAFDMTMPPMDYVDSLEWEALLSETDTVVMEIVQPGLVIGNPGAPVVAAGSHAGMNLPVTGLSANYAAKRGQWVTIITSGQRYAYRLRAAVTASGAGAATLPLGTMLRVPPVAGNVIEIAVPKVEGFPSLDQDALSVGDDRQVQLRFTIEERE